MDNYSYKIRKKWIKMNKSDWEDTTPSRLEAFLNMGSEYLTSVYLGRIRPSLNEWVASVKITDIQQDDHS